MVLFTVNLFSVCSFTPKVSLDFITFVRGDGAEGDHRCWHFFVGCPTTAVDSSAQQAGLSRSCEVCAGIGEDPFARVKDFTELINRLLSRVSSEASHKSHCDYEWAKANEKKTNIKTQVATRSSKLETVVLKSCVLDGKFAELQADFGALSGQRLEMDAMYADKREVFATRNEDLEHGIAGQ